MDYFIEKDYHDDFTKNEYSVKIIESIDHLRSSIKNMNEHNKIKTIKYLQNLCKLSDSYVNN
jgi:tRNA(Ser,Leu) C12 N-acetylase TAN1